MVFLWKLRLTVVAIMIAATIVPLFIMLFFVPDSMVMFLSWGIIFGLILSRAGDIANDYIKKKEEKIEVEVKK